MGGANLNNFPILISRTDTDLKASASSGYVQKDGGKDILFTAANGTTKLNHEIESYTPTTGNLIVWVQATISASFDTIMYVYYGNSSASDQQTAGQVWDGNFKGVWHLADAGPTTADDSTSNANDGVQTGGVTFGATGKINKATSYDGVDDYIKENGTTLANFSGNFSFSGWFQLKEVQDIQGIMGFNSGSTYRYGLSTKIGGAVPRFTFEARLTGGLLTAEYNFATNQSQWYHTYSVYDDTAKVAYLYVDGVLRVTSAAGSGSLTDGGTGDQKFEIGRGYDAIGGTWNADIDEVRFSNAVRSAAWIATEYNNQYSPSTFHAFGKQEARVKTTPGTKAK